MVISFWYWLHFILIINFFFVQHLSISNKPECDGDNLKYIKQLRLQGYRTVNAVITMITNNQRQEKIHLRKPILFYSLFGKFLSCYQ